MIDFCVNQIWLKISWNVINHFLMYLNKNSFQMHFSNMFFVIFFLIQKKNTENIDKSCHSSSIYIL